MTLIIRDGGNVPRTITAVQIRDGSNTPRDITEIRVRDSNSVSRVVFSTGADLSAVASPSDVFGYDDGTGTAQSNATAVVPSGGTPPYTALWFVQSYTGITPPTVDIPASLITSFTQSGLAPGEYTFATFVCTVTDDNGATTQASVTGSFYSQGIVP